MSGHELWSFPFSNYLSFRLNVDAGGKTVWFQTNEAFGLRVDFQKGGVLGRVSAIPIAIGGDEKQWVLSRERGGYLMASDRKKPLIVLGIDSRLSQYAAFDPTGRYLAWGADDGTVGVYDLVEIRRRLGELGLGW